MLAGALFIALMLPGLALVFWIVIGVLRGKADDADADDPRVDGPDDD